jgi:FeS assembly protein IscX
MNWNNIEEIAKNLEETYSEEEIPNENDLAYLKEMVMSLNDFEDHDVKVDDDHLKRIMEYWMELRG